MPVYRLAAHSHGFPDPSEAEPDGLLAVGGDLSPRRLVAAYARGIFPWYSGGGPILWWSPDPRCLLFPEKFHLPRSLARTLRRGIFEISMNRAFAEVMDGCAGGRRAMEGTWLTREMHAAYLRLYRLGFAHSVEAWHNKQLVGGLYGVALGRAFFGESMFYRAPEASKAALAFLVNTLKERDFLFIDCQQVTDNLLRFGAEPLPRMEFLHLLTQALKYGLQP